MADPNTPTRNQIAKVAGNDPEMIKALERLFIVAGDLTPADIAIITQLILDNSFALGAADNKAEVASTIAYAAQRLADLTASQPAPFETSQTDYIDFNMSAPHVSRIRRMAWNDADQTLDLGMDYGVVQQIGLETYARVQNTTGITIPNGTVVGFSGVGAANELSVTPFLSDGSQPSLYILGVLTHDLPDSGEVGYCTVWGHVRGFNTTGSAVSETWSVGDLLYASPSTAGAFTNVKPTAPDNVIPVAAVLSVDATNGEIFVRPTIEQQKYYGQFIKTVDQTPAAINTAYAITFDSSPISNGISIGAPASRIVVSESGLYNFAPTFQVTSGNTSQKNVWFWYRKNGTDVASSAFIATIRINGGYTAVARSDFFSLDAGDYMELMWAADDVNVTLNAVAATAFAPASPACILAVTQVQQ